jgi:hypothetical protein
MSILMMAICGAISGADNKVDVEAYGQAKQGRLETWLDLPDGIASHDSFGRVFRFLNPQAFPERFLGWVRQVDGAARGEGVARDGQQMRGRRTCLSGRKACTCSARGRLNTASSLQHIALTLVRQENSTRPSLNTKRLRAAWHEASLWKIHSA